MKPFCLIIEIFEIASIGELLNIVANRVPLSQKVWEPLFQSKTCLANEVCSMIIIVGEALLCNDVKIIITLKRDVLKGTTDAQEEHC